MAKKPTSPPSTAAGTILKPVTIHAPRMKVLDFHIAGDILMIHRMSAKLRDQLLQKQITGKASGSRKDRQPQNVDATYQEARYRHATGWDGIHAGAFRAAMISACRLVGFKMTLAKLSLFVVQDGQDATEPEIPLVKIIGEPRKHEGLARVETGAPYVTIRALYQPWAAKLRVRFDTDQFTPDDVANLVQRVGMQVGVGEGRPDSKNSAGMGWGLFDIEKTDEVAP